MLGRIDKPHAIVRVDFDTALPNKGQHCAAVVAIKYGQWRPWLRAGDHLPDSCQDIRPAFCHWSNAPGTIAQTQSPWSSFIHTPLESSPEQENQKSTPAPLSGPLIGVNWETSQPSARAASSRHSCFVAMTHSVVWR